MSGGGSGGGTSTTVQKADPWIGVQPGLTNLYGQANDWYNRGGAPEYYGGQTLADSNWNIEHALNLGRDRALGGSAFSRVAQGQNSRTAEGAYLNSNPAQGTFEQFSNGWQMGGNTANQYLQGTANGDFLTDKTNPYLKGLFENASGAVTDQFKNAIAPGLASQFSMAGRTGSGSHSTAFDNASGTLGRTLSQTANSIYGGAYENERGRQQQAMGMLSDNYNTERNMQMQGAQNLSSGRQFERSLQQQAIQFAPQLANMDYADIEKLMELGLFQQSQQQERLSADKARYDYSSNRPLMSLQSLNQLLQGGSSYAGSTGSTTGPGAKRNPLSGAASGAAMGTSIMPGWGTAIGALFGGLFG